MHLEPSAFFNIQKRVKYKIISQKITTLKQEKAKKYRS
ncbi:hypothetical protein SynPROS91_01168 [Synechococcus sp. PROS-9-1]|nr:hypothetical protein SynPROS91_01168 [Synechococcus sp. PROS-9-1]